MAVFSTIVAAFAVFNVALASTDFSSAESSAPCSTATVTATTAMTVTNIVTLLPSSSGVPSSSVVSVTPSSSISSGVVSMPIISEKPTGPYTCHTTTVSMHGTSMQEIKCTGVSIPAVPASTPSASLSSVDISVSKSAALPSTTATEILDPIISIPRPSMNITTMIPPPHSATLVFSSTFKNSTSIVPTKTGGASASASYSAPPEFTDAATGVKIGAAALIGGVAMALFA